MGAEQREFTRLPMHLWGIYTDTAGNEQICEVEQVSLRGGHMLTEFPRPLGEGFALRLTNDLTPEALVIEVVAVARNHYEDGMGLEFTSMPLESYEHLTRQLELYAHDPDQVMREIHEHVGLKSLKAPDAA